MSLERLLNSSEAARILGTKPRTLESWRYRGCGPRYVFMSGRAVRYRIQDLEEWVEERLRTSTMDAAIRP